MLTAREVDRLEQQFTARGEAFFHVSGAGHEAVAALGPHLQPEDWLHCHYRDKALLLARGVTPEMILRQPVLQGRLALARGRQMSAHGSWRAGQVLSLCGAGRQQRAAGGRCCRADRRRRWLARWCCALLATVRRKEGEVLEAIAEAVRESLPVLFLIEDNRFAISTLTRGRTFYPCRTRAQLVLRHPDPARRRARPGCLLYGVRRKPSRSFANYAGNLHWW